MVGVGAGPEAQKTEPDKNTYLVFKQGQSGPDPAYDYGTHFLYQGHEGGSHRERAEAGLHHADQPRRGRRSSRDAARVDRTTRATRSRRSTARRGIRGHSGCSSRRRTRAHRPTRRRRRIRRPSRTSPVRSAVAATRASRTTRDGNIWIVEDIGGAIKTGTTAAKIPNSFIYPLRARRIQETWQHGKLQALQVLNDAKHPITSSRRPHSTRPTRSRCTATARSSRRSG